MKLNENQIKYKYRVLNRQLPKIKIIEHFFANSNNTAQQIADIYELTLNQVHTVLNEYFLNDKTITIESKMNYGK